MPVENGGYFAMKRTIAGLIVVLLLLVILHSPLHARTT
jgi:hypothetical protein